MVVVTWIYPDDTSLYFIAVSCNLCRKLGSSQRPGVFSRSADKSRLCTMPIECQCQMPMPIYQSRTRNGQNPGTRRREKEQIKARHHGSSASSCTLITKVMRKRSRSPPITCPTQRATLLNDPTEGKRNSLINPTSTWPPVREEKKRGCIQQPRRL